MRVRALIRLANAFRRCRRGNVAILTAISIVPIIFACGAAADYGFATKIRSDMNAALDAAALAAVSPQQMAGTTVAATLVAQNLFNSQVSSLSRLVYNSPVADPTCLKGTNGYTPNAGINLCIQVTDAIVNTQRVRTAVVAYRAAVTTAFSGILQMQQITIGGSSTATASTSPNIDFYLLLDTSPSMAIPSTTAGIAQMVSLTKYQDSGGGCAFACHETSPQIESGSASYKAPIFGNPGCPDDPNRGRGPCLDNYQLALNNNIPLRITLVNQAVQNLVNTAQSTAAATGAAYQLAGYTFDDTVKQAFALQLPTQQTINQAKANINMLVVDHENSDNGDQNTVFDSSTDSTAGAFPQILSAMNAAYNNKGAGSGTNNIGDRPQQVMMLVTDGVSDQTYNGSRIYNPIGGATNTVSNMNSLCSKIKANTNIRIAVLYLVYNPLPMKDGKGNATWYSGHVAPLQSSIAPTLQNCASSPSLFYQVNTDGDISAAMSSLFSAAVSSARLTN
jgi:Flp pilus assembly protein TadG